MYGLVESIEKEGKLFTFNRFGSVARVMMVILNLKRNSTKDMTNDLLRDEPDNGLIHLT